MKDKDFDQKTAEDQKKLQRKCRSQVRKVIENAGAEMGCAGVCTTWIVIAEFSGIDDEGDPIKTLWVDHAYHDDSPLAPWVFRGMVLDAVAESSE